MKKAYTSYAARFMIVFMLAFSMAVLPAVTGVYAEGELTAGDETGAEDELIINNGLPVVYLTVDESRGTIENMHDSVDHSEYCYGTMRIDVPDGFHYSDLPGALTKSTEELEMSMRGRGNSTWQRAAKKPYKIKLEDKADFLGRGKSKHWVLVANFFDPTQIRDRITGWLGDRYGFEFTPRGVPVDVVLTGEEYGTKYLGAYYLSENVRVEKTRLNIDELTKDDTEMPAISGGYLLQDALQTDKESPDVFYTRRGIDWATDTPSFDTRNDEELQEAAQEFLGAYPDAGIPDHEYLEDAYDSHVQQQYIQDHIQLIEDVLYAEDYTFGGYTHYRDLIDTESAAMYWLVNEVTLNGDAFKTGSTYIYKKRDPDGKVGKLYWGPLWDFDFAYNYRPYTENFNEANEYMNAMLYDPEFRKEIYELWPDLKTALGELTAERGIIDKYAEETCDSAEADRGIWSYDHADTYQEDIDDLKNWIDTRVVWFDEHLQDLEGFMHKVRFFADGEEIRTEFVQDGLKLFDDEKIPEKEGYVFLGWFDEDGNKIDFDIPVSKDSTYTARYVSEEDATHGEDIVFNKANDIIAFVARAPQYQIRYTVIPTDAEYQAVEWTSSDENFATVDENGVVSFSGPGEVTLTAKLKYGGSRDFNLTITDGEVPYAEAMVPEKEIYELTTGSQAGISVVTTPSPARIDDYTYTSDDESVVKAYDNGVITAVGPGETKVHIIASSYSSFEPLCETEATVRVTDPAPEKKSIANAAVTVPESVTYTGKAMTPPVTVTLDGKTLVSGTDYTLTYSNNKKVGAAGVTVKGMNSYSGTKESSFRIIPKPTKFKYVRTARKGFRAKWKKVTKEVSGYQIRWSTEKDMSGAKTKSFKSAKKVTFRKTKLKSRSTYYVQVRTYKTVGGIKYYSGWSKKRKVKTR